MKTNSLIQHAKFYQNELWNSGIKNYLIGGALINSVRDNGSFLSDDIDFAVVFETKNENTINSFVFNLLKNSPAITYTIYEGVLSLHFGDKKIDFFFFIKKYLNYYMFDINWLHERIYSFQTFKEEKVVLEKQVFTTMYRPDLFLKTVYGDFRKKIDNYHDCSNMGDTSHMRRCYFYTDEKNYDKIDFQYENLKLFFPEVVVKRNLNSINNLEINVYDDCFKDFIDCNNLFISEFENYMIVNKIKSK